MAKQRPARRNHAASARTKAATVSAPAAGPGPSTEIAIEVAFWIVLLTCAFRSGKYYWRVVFITAASARLLYLALGASLPYLPEPEFRFASIILYGTWASAAFAYGLLLLYGIFLTPLHLIIYSPMDAWTKYQAAPDPLDDFRVHYDPGIKTEVDVIAIHGLGSNPDTAWASNRGKPGQPVLWLRDLLPTDPQLDKARIIQVNQQTRWDTSVSTLSFNEHAKNLFQILESVHKVRGRPIVYIAHSFGGLLLKKALLLAKHEESSVATDARGLLFLGVPHGGTEAAFFASILSCTAYWRGSSTTLLQVMAPETDTIESLESEFYSSFVLHKMHRSQILPRIVDFSEQRPERIGPLPLGKTVNNRTRGIHHGEEVNLDTDHRGLNKFASVKDPNYQKVLAQILETIKYAAEHMSSLEVGISPTDNLPFDRDWKFVPRDNIVDEICQRILSSKNHLRQAIVGLGGMGKSQVAIEVSYSLREAYSDIWVFWVRAGSATKFKDSYSLIAYTVGILKPEESDTPANLASLVRSWLQQRQNGKWVLILDGADDMSVFYPDQHDTSNPQYRSWLPRVAHGSILITTRNRAVALNLIGSPYESNTIFSLSSMSHEQAAQLLKSKVPEPLWDDEDADNIVRELEYIPLAISHAAAYIDYNADTLEEYLSKIRTLQAQPSPQDKIHDLRRDDDAPSSVVIAWQSSFDQIRATSESAAELLCLMSVFDNQNIPEFFIAKPMAVGYIDSLGGIDPVAQKYIEKYGGKDKRPTAPQRTDTTDSLEAGPNSKSSTGIDDATLSNWLVYSDQRLRDDIGLLYNYKMISVDKTRRTYSMHSLLQTAISKWVESGGNTAYTLQDYRDRSLIEVSMAFKLEGVPGIYESAALHQNAAKVLEYETGPRVMLLHRAEVLYHQADYLVEIGQLELAEKYIKEAIDIRRQHSVGCTIPVVKALQVHADICYEQGRCVAAEMILREALEGFSVSMGFSRNLKDDISESLGLALMGQNRFEEAESFIESAVKSESTRLGYDAQPTLESRRMLAHLYSQMGDSERAIDELRKVVVDWERRQNFEGSDTERMIIAKSELVELLRNAGLVGEAERLAEGLLPTAVAELGDGHNTTAKLRLRYATSLKALGKFDAAEVVLRDAHAQTLLAMDASHPQRQKATFALVNLLHQRNSHADIVALGSPAEMYKVPPEGEHIQHYWTAAAQYAYALHALERFTEAKVAYEALPSTEADFDDSSYNAVFWKLNYAGCLEDLELYEECIVALDGLRDWRNSTTDSKLVHEYDNIRRKAERGLKGKNTAAS